MSTRKLILLALVCGLVILLAGGVKLVQVATDEAEVTVLTVGDQALVGDMVARVLGVSLAPSGTAVQVEMSGTAATEASAGWIMLGDGERLEPTGVCGPVAAQSTHQCTLTFPAVDRVQAIAYARGGEQRQWRP